MTNKTHEKLEKLVERLRQASDLLREHGWSSAADDVDEGADAVAGRRLLDVALGQDWVSRVTNAASDPASGPEGAAHDPRAGAGIVDHGFAAHPVGMKCSICDSVEPPEGAGQKNSPTRR